MRFATYVSPRDGAEHVALVEGGRLLGLPDRRLIDLLGPDQLADAADRARGTPLEVLAEADAVLRAPVPTPPSIRDFMAFEQHVVTASAALGREVHPDWYELPVFYFTNPAAVLGPTDDVPVSPGSAAFDFELEVAVVVGTPGRDLDPAGAEAHIAGYTLFCDWSARDVQAREMTLGLGPAKGKDGSTSLGPYLVTPDELPSRGVRRAPPVPLTAAVNGEVLCHGDLADLYWGFGELLAYASRGTELRPGDVLGSGTVGGGCLLELRTADPGLPWLAAGDEVRLEAGVLGTIEARVVAGARAVPLR